MLRKAPHETVERPGRRRAIGLASSALFGARQVFAQTPPRAMELEMDFTDPARVSMLRVVNDGVMGGVSRSALLADPAGVVFSGEVSLANNGGFASMRGPVAFAPGTSRLTLTARGDGKRYKLILRTDPDTRTPIHQCDFVANDWHTHRFSPADFRPTFRGRDVAAPPLVLSEAVEFGILIADGQAGSFKIQLRTLQAD